MNNMDNVLKIMFYIVCILGTLKFLGLLDSIKELLNS